MFIKEAILRGNWAFRSLMLLGMAQLIVLILIPKLGMILFCFLFPPTLILFPFMDWDWNKKI